MGALAGLAAGITLAVWLVIGAVIGVAHIVAMHHATVFGKAALLTALAWGVVLSAAFIWFGPVSEWLER